MKPQIVIETPVAPHDPALYASEGTPHYVAGHAAIDDRELGRYRERGYMVVRGGFDGRGIEVARRTLEALVLSDAPPCAVIFYEGEVRLQAFGGEGKGVTC